MNETELRKLLETLLDQREKGLLDNAEFIKKLSEQVTATLKANFGDIEQLKKNLQTISDELKTLRTGVRDCNVDQLDKLYKGPWGSVKLAQDFGLYIMAGCMGSAKAAEILRARGYTLEKAMTSGDNPSGGLLVPVQIIDGFIMLVAEYGIARRKCVVWPMASDTDQAFMLTSGLTVSCVAEGTAPTAQELQSRLLTLNAQEWVVYVAVNRSLDEDAAIMLGNVIGELMAMAFAEQEDNVLFNGNGTSTYFRNWGITGRLLALTTPKGLITGTGSGWSGLTLANHRSMQGVLHKAAWNGEGPSWYCSPQYYFDVMMRLADAVGGATQTEITMSEAMGKRRFLGLPVEFAPLPSTTASAHVPCVLGNLRRGAMMGDRRKTAIEQSREALFLQRQIAILGTERVAFNVYGCHDVATDQQTRAGTIVGVKTG